MKIYFEEVFPQYVHSYENVISIPIVDTSEINEMIDRERVKNGKCPFFTDVDGFDMDMDGWYEIRLILNRETCEPVELEAWTENGNDPDENVYHIEIDDKEEVMECLMAELKRNMMTIDELKEIE